MTKQTDNATDEAGGLRPTSGIARRANVSRALLLAMDGVLRYAKLSRPVCKCHRVDALLSLFLAIAGIALALQTGCAEAQVVDDDRVTAYSKSFAKRFALPEDEAVVPDDQSLKAVEVTLGFVQPARSLSCQLRLYIDSALPIETPLGSDSGAREILSLRTHFFMSGDSPKRWMKLSEGDRRYFGHRQNAFNALAALATPDYQVGGIGSFATVPFHSFLRDVVPGITFVQLTVPCTWIQAFGSKYVGIHVLLKKRGAKDYGNPSAGQVDPGDFVRVELPTAFLRKAREQQIKKSQGEEPTTKR